MGFISKILDDLHKENVKVELDKVNKLYLGWQHCTNEKEVLDVLNAALSVSEVIKEKYTSSGKFYNQFVMNSNDVTAVYYCKQSNTIKSI
ncbi:hypothetical protein WNY81_20310 [Shewanella frigidimarina]|uniref:hypothetical protein n=1 Tax=Shewanella frigidimarina TaxID=56812 RepID=UPI00316C2E00